MAALSSSSSGGVGLPRPGPSKVPVREQAAAKVSPAYQPPGVERGVSGKEKQFQQNRAFGPGPIKPYLKPGGQPSQSMPKQAARSTGTGPENLARKGLVPSHTRAHNAIGTGERPRVGDGVYRGWGSKGTSESGIYKRGESRA